MQVRSEFVLCLQSVYGTRSHHCWKVAKDLWRKIAIQDVDGDLVGKRCRRIFYGRYKSDQQQANVLASLIDCDTSVSPSVSPTLNAGNES